MISDDEARKLTEEAIHWYLAMKAQLYHYHNSEDSIPKWKDKGQVVAAEDFDMLALKDADLLLERARAEKAEQAFNEWENKAGQYREERDKAEKELETERMRLAGCSAAAL